jgi:structural maintenance of chromosomes protein 6
LYLGRAVGKGQSELAAILEHFNIQVNNPCAILMQDTSRQFLAGSSEKEKYSVPDLL